MLTLEAAPWARPRAPYTRDFEDVVAWLAQQTAKTPITKLMRIGWESVGKIVERVVADHLDEGRLDGLVWLGVDEISYQADHRFLTCVADHQTGGGVWAAPGRNAATLQRFFDQLTAQQKASIRAAIDMSAASSDPPLTRQQRRKLERERAKKRLQREIGRRVSRAASRVMRAPIGRRRSPTR